MIGVLAVIAILAAALIPILIKQMDQAAAEKETRQLKTFADALREGIVKTKYVPGTTGTNRWDEMISSTLGLSLYQVRTNDRRLARVFLIDPDFQLQRVSESASPPPYSQNIGGSIIPPVSPRLLMLSSLSQPLPVTNGLASSATAFNNIWTNADGNIPAGWTWSARGEDLKIQRIHIADLFVELILNYEAGSGGSGLYSIEMASPAYSGNALFDRYFIDSSLLKLFDCSNSIPRYCEILHRSKSFSFANCSWQSGSDFVARAIDRPNPLDLQLAANAFLTVATNSPWRDGWPTRNVKPPYVEPSIIYDRMTNYMTKYIFWRTNSPTGVSGDAAVSDAQTDLKNSTLYLIDPNN